MPDQPVHELSREVHRMLVVAQDSGTAATIAGMREALGLGHDELQAILSQLHGEGMAVQVSPDGWEAAEHAVSEPEAVVVSGASARAATFMDERDGRDGEDSKPVQDPYTLLSERPWPGSLPAEFSPPSGTRVRLSRAMVEALDDEALGKLIHAGVQADAEPFYLLVG